MGDTISVTLASGTNSPLNRVTFQLIHWNQKTFDSDNNGNNNNDYFGWDLL